MKIYHIAALVIASVLSAPAFAHTGLHIGRGFSSGVAHPFLGLDHLLAMVMVGLWAAQQQGVLRRAAPPVVFVLFMAIGGVLGQSGIGFVLPNVETGIAVSVLGLGLLTAFAVRLPMMATLPLISVFALFHGHAHGAEMPAVALSTLAFPAYLAGFVLATALLHAAGFFTASRLLNSQGYIVRSAGLLAALAGGNLLLG
jgi:urease accessory protein